MLIAQAAVASATPLGTVTQHNVLTAGAKPVRITAGADGNLWFSEREAGGEEPGVIGRVTPAGVVSEFKTGLAVPSGPHSLTVGGDGDVWFSDTYGHLGSITPAGVITEFTAGLLPGEPFPYGVALGSDGNVWFAERGAPLAIGRITPSGAITNFTAGLTPKSEPDYLTAGADGNVWFTEYEKAQIGRITPAGTITEFSKGITPGSHPLEIAAGPDGNLWFTQGEEVGRITPAGAVTEFKVFAGDTINGIAPGPDGNMWVTGSGSKGAAVFRLTTAGIPTEFAVLDGEPGGIATGADGNLWVTEYGSHHVASFGTGVPAASVAAPSVAGGTRTGSALQCTGAAWSTWAGSQPSAELHAFDGYRWLLDGAVVASGSTFTPPAGDAGHALSCSETVTYPVLGTTASAAAAAVTLTAPPSGPPAPVLGALRISARTFRESRRAASISRAHRPPVGTVITFTLNESAAVRLSFTQSVAGRKVGGACRAPGSRNRRRPACRRTQVRGTISFQGHAGTNTIRFYGRLSSSRSLPPGAYRATAVATIGTGASSAPASLAFTIVK